MNDKYMEEFEKAWDQLHNMQVGEGGEEGGGPGSSAAAARAGSSLAARQRNIYASLEEPSEPPYSNPYSAAPSSSSGPIAGR